MRRLFAVLLATMLAASAPAQQDEGTRATVAMSQPVFEALQAAQESIEAGRHAAGIAALAELRGRGGLSSYESAQIWNLTAYAHYLAEQYPRAIDAYTNVLKQADLPEALVQSTLKTLAQLYFTVEDFRRALSTVDRLIELLPEPSADIYMLKGQAHFQLEQHRLAVTPIETAIELYRAQGRTPRENWLLLLRVCHYELGNFEAMLAVLKELIRLYPRQRYIETLAGVHSERGDTAKQLALSEALYEDGRLENPLELVNLANLYLVHGLPYKAATLLERESAAGRIESDERNLRLLSQAWYQAREDSRAIPPLERAAALADDGELYMRLAQSHLNLEQWEAAAEAVRRGLARGGVQRPDTAQIMLGMALFNQRKLEAARRAFLAAAEDRRSARAAQQWLAYVESERERAASLDQELPEKAQRAQDALLEGL